MRSLLRAKDTIADLSRQPLEGKDSIETMVSELAALGKSSDDIERISKAAVYLSNVTGRDLDLICAILNRISGFAVSVLKIREHVFPDGYRFAVLIHKGVYLIYSGGTEDVTRIGFRSRSYIFMGFMLTKGITSGAIVSLRELEARSMVSSGFSTPHILPSSRTPI